MIDQAALLLMLVGFLALGALVCALFLLPTGTEPDEEQPDEEPPRRVKLFRRSQARDWAQGENDDNDKTE